MIEKPYTSDIKTVLKVDQQFETVKQLFSVMLREDTDTSNARVSKLKKNSFSFGWVKSFSVTTIKVKIVKESDRSTAIWVEARKPGDTVGEKRIAHDGFYDFLQFLRRKFATQEVTPGVSENAEYAGAWVMLFVILLTLFLSWYYHFSN